MTAAAWIVLATVLVIALWICAQWKGLRLQAAGPRWPARWGVLAVAAAAVLIPLAAAASGRLAPSDRLPPPVAFVLAYIVGGALFLSRSRFGDRVLAAVPLPGLVAFQSFRVLAELALLAGLRQGLAPRALTLEGYNFDLVLALSALPMAWWIRRGAPLRWVRAWNLAGCLFLAVIAVLAATTMPGPLRLFMEEPSNVWVTHAPYCLLPGVLVLAAFTGHLLTFRQLKALERQ